MKSSFLMRAVLALTVAGLCSSAIATPPQISREFSQTAGGGINVHDPLTDTFYTVTLNTSDDPAVVNGYDVYYSISRIPCDETGCLYEDIASGVARGVGGNKVRLTRTGIRIDTQPEDWTEVWSGVPFAVDVTSRDAGTNSVWEKVGPRIETTPCSRRTINGERWELDLEASGAIADFYFDSSVYPTLPPYWYFVAHGEKGKIREQREIDCPNGG